MTKPTRRSDASDPQTIAVSQDWRRTIQDVEPSRARRAHATGDSEAKTDGTEAHATLRTRLRSPQRLREAFLLREIIGPPRGLEPGRR